VNQRQFTRIKNGHSTETMGLGVDDKWRRHGFMPIRPGMKPEASKPLAGGQRSATAKKPSRGMAASRLRTVSASGTVSGSLLSADFADWFYQFFICVPLRHLRIHCSVSDRNPVCCVSGRPRLAKRVCGGLSRDLFLAGISIRLSVFGFFCLTVWRNSFSNPGHFSGNETVGGAASC